MIQVKTRTGILDYEKEELVEIINKFEMYLHADNLVKWLLICQMNHKKFNPKKIKNFIQQLVNNWEKETLLIDVSNDDYSDFIL